MELDDLNTSAPEVQPAPTQDSAPPASEPEEQADEGPIDLDAVDESEAPDDAQEVTDEASDEAADEQADEGPQFVDFEIEPGKTVKIDPELQPYLMREKDYRQKTQAVAEMRREVEAEKAYVAQTKTLSDEEMQAKAVLFNIDGELAKYQSTDWQKLMDEDPFGAQSQFMRYQQLEKARSQVLDFQQTLAQQRSQITEQETVNRMRATAEFAKKNIKGFSPELDAKITDFALSKLGTSRESLMQQINPQVYDLLHLAYIGSQALTRQAAVKPATPTVQPTKTVNTKGNAAITKDPDAMSMSEYVAYREAQMRRNRR